MLYARFFTLIWIFIYLDLEVESYSKSCNGYFYKYSRYRCTHPTKVKREPTRACGYFWRRRCTRHYYYRYMRIYRSCTRAQKYYYSWASWGRWSSWSSCGVTCGYGYKKRFRCRRCNYKYVSCSSHGARQIQYSRCYGGCCIENGGWNIWKAWQRWGSCSRSCGGGIQTRNRYRSCTKPRPTCGGSSCTGSSVVTQQANCNNHCCPKNGTWTGWGTWHGWSTCTRTCGGGTKYKWRYRSCSKPLCGGGSSCSGSSRHNYYVKCNWHCCLKNGNWEKWNSWNNIGTCSKTCGNGEIVQQRRRKCKYPDPRCKGDACPGDSQGMRTTKCHTEECPDQCICKASGDPHYRTFDGQMIHFMGTSQYTLAKSTKDHDSCKFNIEVKNEHRYGNYRVSYTKYVDFEMYGRKIGLRKNGTVLLEGVMVFLPLSVQNDKIKIYNIGGNVYVKTECGIHVRFEWDHLVTVIVPGSYRNYTTGICGKCDGIQNDYVTKDGIDVSSKLNKYSLIGSSYDVAPTSNDSSTEDDWDPECNVRMRNLITTDSYCGLLQRIGGVFGQCIRNITEMADVYFESCKIDVCENDNEKMVEKIKCETVEGFAEECKQSGFQVKWRSAKFCPLICDDPNKIYMFNGPGCPSSCATLDDDDNCTEPSQEGCFCKNGYVQSGNKCVPKTQCGCVEQNGENVQYYPLGHTKVSKTCMSSHQCKHVNGKPQFVRIPSSLSCHSSADCQLNDDGKRACVCKTGYYGDGYKSCTRLMNIAVPQNTKRIQLSLRFNNNLTSFSESSRFKSHLAKALSEVLGISRYRIDNVKISKGNGAVALILMPRRKGTKEPNITSAINDLHKRVRLNKLPITDPNGKQLNVDRTYFQHSFHVSKPCECIGTGDPHYKTYDGPWIHFMGICKYTLTMSTLKDDSCAFHVVVKNEHRGHNKKVSYTKYVETYIKGTQIGFFKNGHIRINGSKQYLPFNKNNGEISISMNGRYTQLTTSCEIKVEFDGNSYVKVTIPDKYRNHTTGICGNCNGVADEFRMKDGTPVSSDRVGQALIGNSYKVKDGSVDGCDIVLDEEKCSDSTKKKIPTNEYCGLITNITGPFKDCIKNYPDVAKQDYELCAFDICAYENNIAQLERAKCFALEGFAAYCEDEFPVQWRSPSFCPMKCKDPNAVYKSEGPACHPTCVDLRASTSCPFTPKEGCFCKPGLVMSGNSCVPKSYCGCIDNEGNYLPVGRRRTTTECGQEEECMKPKDGPAKLVQKISSNQCHKNADCLNNARGEKQCFCKNNFIGNGYTSCKATPKVFNRVSVHVRLLHNFTKTVGDNEDLFAKHLASLIASLVGISKHRISNLRLSEGSGVVVNFDILPKRGGSKEPNMESALKKLIASLESGSHSFFDLDKNALKHDKYSMTYRFDTTSHCTCTGSGDPHYRTFDGDMIHFMGTSRYIMVESLDDDDDCKFKVLVKNEHRYGSVRVSYTKNVLLDLGGDIIELQKSGIALVNQRRVYTPFLSPKGNFEIKNTGGNLYITSRCGVSVSFEGDHLVTVKVPGRYRGNLTGICGDCDGKRNDFRTADGTDVSDKPDKFFLIGSSYNTEAKNGSFVGNTSGECSVRMTDLVATNNYCGLFTSTSGPFKQCIADDPELASEYFESCKVDVCENEGEPSLETIKCQTFQGYAEDCKEEGFHVKWRTSRFCPGKCDDPNMEYIESGQRCTPTCVDQNMNNDSCSDEGISGCFCKDGFVLSDMKCVQKSECGCRDVKGQYYPIGHIKKSSSCLPSEECRRVNGRSVFVKLSSSKSCHSMAKCQLNTKGEEACVCGVGFYGDGYNCSEIPNITLPSKTKRVKVSLQFMNEYSGAVGKHVGKSKEHFIKAIAEIMKIPFHRLSEMDLQEGNTSTMASFYILPKRDEGAPSKLGYDVNNLQRLVRTNALPVTDVNGKKLLINPNYFKYTSQRSRPCRCTGYGDPHYKTYDGQIIDFMGTCQYTLTKSTTDNDTCAFNVEVKNEHRGSNTAVSYTKYVEVDTFSVRATLKKNGKVLVDKQSISLPFQSTDGNVKIFRSGRYVRMTSICDVTVEFDGHSYVSVQIPDKYRGFTTGICGVCDDKQNDYKTKDGKDVSGSGDRDRLLGNSYKVMRSSEDGCEDKPETSVTCSTELQREVESYDICGIISNGTGPFRKCIQAYPDLVKKYFDICVFDVCANKDSKRLMEMMRCQALEGWAEECAEFSIAWRSDKTCPLNCGENTVYASSGTACPATCMDLRAPSNCLDPPVESCLCKDGFVLSDDQCVPRHKCGCVDSKGKYYEIGEKTVIETCGGLIYECQGQSNDTSKLIPLEERKPCHKNATCGFDEDGIQRCMCLKGFIGDGTENCRQMPSGVRLASMSMTFNDAYNEAIGDDYNKHRLSLMRAIASTLKISRPRVTNLRIRNESRENGRTEVTFDLLPKRVGSSEASLSQAINALSLRFSKKKLKIPFASDKGFLTPDYESLDFKIDQSKLHTCLGYGDPHYKTFDGQLIDFMGTCKYTMVKASGLDSHCAFHVKVQNEYRGGNTHVSFTKFIDFDIYGTTIRLLKQKKVLVNKERKKVPFQMQNADISIVETGQYIQVDSGCGVSVKFDGDSTVSVHVPDTYMNRTEGICGNFDGYENDYRTKDGKDVSTEKYKFALIGNSYKIDEESQTGCKNGKSAFGVCSSETLKEVESVNSCGIIMDENGPFQECIEEDPINAKNIFKTCKFDVCSYEDDIVRRTILLCDDIVAFALHCEAIGFSVSWRTSSLCPMACNNATEVFKSDGTGCEASCRDPYAEEKCVFENTEGCFCREGLIRSDTHCVDPSLCGCVDTNGEYYELGDRKTNTNCTHSLECRKVGTKSKLIDVQTNKCHLLANCEFNDEGQRTCICKEGYTGDGNTKCSPICKEEHTQYYRRGEACNQTCENYAASEICSTNEEIGCFCRNGYAFHKGRCVDASSECGCMDKNNYYHEIGESWSGQKCGETYSCSSGETRSNVTTLSEGAICHPKASCKTNKSGKRSCKCKYGYQGDGVNLCRKCFCMVFSRTRYRTFDRQILDFNETCKYTLAKTTDPNITCAFHIKVKNEHRYGYTKNAYTKYVEIDVHGYTITLLDNMTIQVDGIIKSHPYFKIPEHGLTVRRSGSYLKLRDGCGLKVGFNGRHIARVVVPATINSKLTGLCGNCNGKKDDYGTGTGLSDYDIAKSYEIPGSCKQN